MSTLIHQGNESSYYIVDWRRFQREQDLSGKSSESSISNPYQEWRESYTGLSGARRYVNELTRAISLGEGLKVVYNVEVDLLNTLNASVAELEEEKKGYTHLLDRLETIRNGSKGWFARNIPTIHRYSKRMIRKMRIDKLRCELSSIYPSRIAYQNIRMLDLLRKSH